MPTAITYCTVESCERRCHGHGHCLMHYKRLRTHGTTDGQSAEYKSELNKRISQTLVGRKLTKEHKVNIANGLVGKVATGEKNGQWKGDNVGYPGVHKWVREKLGTPSHCENCEATEDVIFDWANLSYEYKRDISDWARLCRRCHFLIDGVGLYMRNKTNNQAGAI